MLAPPHQKSYVEKAFLFNTGNSLSFSYIKQNCQKWLKRERKNGVAGF
jgi:hypothetical protein